MARGLVLGKFMPLHTGHISLIDFALNHCDELIVWVCVSSSEEITADTRYNWVKSSFIANPKIRPVLFQYSEDELPNSSVSSMEISALWAKAILDHLPAIDMIFTTEDYGDFVAALLGIRHMRFPYQKIISATEIRLNPFGNWQFLPEIIRPYYVKKVAILGTESTGKTVLTKKLARHYKTAYVSEVGRTIVEHSNTCTWNNLKLIANAHAKKIIQQLPKANKLLVIDTDIHITQSYAKFLFNKELLIDNWISQANQADLYLYLWNDAQYIQDGTRLNKSDRDKLHSSHIENLDKNNITYRILKGKWEQRFQQAIEIIDAEFGFRTPGSIFHPI